MARASVEARHLLSPGLAQAPVLDLLSSHFVLTLALRSSGRFNLRRDWNSLLSLTGKHLVWPATVLARLRGFLNARCKANEHWRGHEALADDAFIARHGAWRGPYEEGTLFFYIDEYIKDAPKDLLADVEEQRALFVRAAPATVAEHESLVGQRLVAAPVLVALAARVQEAAQPRQHRAGPDQVLAGQREQAVPVAPQVEAPGVVRRQRQHELRAHAVEHRRVFQPGGQQQSCFEVALDHDASVRMSPWAILAQSAASSKPRDKLRAR